jgi:WD40 repeat protein
MKSQKHVGQVEIVVFSKASLMLAASGGMDRCLKVYDVKKLNIRTSVEHDAWGGITRLLFSEKYDYHLFVATTFGEIHEIDSRNNAELRTFKGHIAPIMDIKENTELDCLVTAGDDNVCKVFRLN